LAEIDGLRILVNPVLERSLKAEQITIAALGFADDRLSLETDYGKRLTLSVEPMQRPSRDKVTGHAEEQKRRDLG